MCFCAFQIFSRACFRLGLEMKYISGQGTQIFYVIVVILFPLHELPEVEVC